MFLAVFFALCAAILFSFGLQFQKKALASLDDLSGTFISVATMATIFWIMAPWVVEREFWATRATLYFAIAGLLFPAMGQRFQIASVRHVGPALSSAFGAFLPVFAVIPAILFLDEDVTATQFLGIALVMGGLIGAAMARGAGRRPQAAIVFLLPIGAAAVRGITQPLTKAGYATLPEPLFAMLVVTTVSTLLIGLMVLTGGSPARIARPTRAHYLFMLNGLFIGMGILGIQLSLLHGTVTLTASIVSVVPVLTLLLSIYVFRSEQLRWWHALVAVTVTTGAILVVAGAS